MRADMVMHMRSEPHGAYTFTPDAFQERTRRGRGMSEERRQRHLRTKPITLAVLDVAGAGSRGCRQRGHVPAENVR
jgi:hypothetical protein